MIQKLHGFYHKWLIMTGNNAVFYAPLSGSILLLVQINGKQKAIVLYPKSALKEKHKAYMNTLFVYDEEYVFACIACKCVGVLLVLFDGF